MISDKYEVVLLKKLLFKYEKSKLSTVGSSKRLKIGLKLDENTLPEYVDEDSYQCEMEIVAAIKSLAEKNFIEYDFQNGRIGKVVLNLEVVEEVYNFLNLDSPKVKRERYLKIVDSYKRENMGNLVSFFSTMVMDMIVNYKSHGQYFNTEEDLQEIFLILDKLDSQKEEISRRTFSSRYLNDSKRLEVVQPRIEKIIKECTGLDGNDVLGYYNIYKNPTYMYLKGDVVVKVNEETIDLKKLSHELILPSSYLHDLSIVSLDVSSVITVENLTTFYEYPVKESLIVYLGGYHNEVRKRFLLKIFDFNRQLKFYHSGDIDAGGFYILNHLIEDTGILFVGKDMGVNTLIKYNDYTKELTNEDIKRLNNLKCQRYMTDYFDVIDYMLENNVKLEQENIDYD